MIQQAMVTKILDGGKFVEVQVTRQSSCGHDCASCKGCSTSDVMKIKAVVENRIGVRQGDWVFVEAQTKNVLVMALILYILPVLLFLVFYWASMSLGIPINYLPTIGILGFLFGIVIAYIYNNKVKKGNNIFKLVKKVR